MRYKAPCLRILGGMLHAIASAFIGVAAFISSLFGVAPQQQLGAGLPSGTAVFETSLQSRISSTDTSLTLIQGVFDTLAQTVFTGKLLRPFPPSAAASSIFVAS
jgi:hypothetical protein